METNIKDVVDINKLQNNVDEIDMNEFDNSREKLKNYESEDEKKEAEFKNRYGAIKLFLIKRRLNKYINKRDKYEKLYKKYDVLHASLSLAVIAGFSNIKKHYEYINELTNKIKANKDGNN